MTLLFVARLIHGSAPFLNSFLAVRIFLFVGPECSGTKSPASRVKFFARVTLESGSDAFHIWSAVELVGLRW